MSEGSGPPADACVPGTWTIPDEPDPLGTSMTRSREPSGSSFATSISVIWFTDQVGDATGDQRGAASLQLHQPATEACRGLHRVGLRPGGGRGAQRDGRGDVGTRQLPHLAGHATDVGGELVGDLRACAQVDHVRGGPSGAAGELEPVSHGPPLP